jgi:hypothetical protein
MKRVLFYCVCISLFLYASASAKAGEWRFPVGLSYISGIQDIKDLYTENLEHNGYSVSDTVNIPVGLAFQPYLQMDNGLGYGMAIGPMSMVLTNVVDYYNFPIGADVRYTFLNSSNASPYVRAGLRYNIASGDYVKSSSPGLFGAVGFEIFKKSHVSMGLELSYDSSQVEFKNYKVTHHIFHDYWGNSYDSPTWEQGTTKIKPSGLMFSLYAIF